LGVLRSALKRAENLLSREHYELILAFNTHCENQGLREKTRDIYLRYTTDFLRFLEKKGLSVWKLSTKAYLLIDLFFSEARMHAPGSIGLYTVSIKKLLKYLYYITEDEKYIKLYEKIKVPRKARSLPEILSPEEVIKIIDNITDIKYKVAVAILYEAGVRAREVLNLKIKDVEFDRYGARITVRSSKSEPRVVRITAFSMLLWAWIESHPNKGNPEAYLFYGKSPDKPLSYQALWKKLKQAARRAGIRKNIHPHLFRHTRATEFYGVFREKEMMLWFGWKTRRMIDVYSKITQEDIEEKYLAITGVKQRDNARRALTPEKCPRCGTWLPPNAKYCPICGLPTSPRELIKILRKEMETRSSNNSFQD